MREESNIILGHAPQGGGAKVENSPLHLHLHFYLDDERIEITGDVQQNTLGDLLNQITRFNWAFR